MEFFSFLYLFILIFAQSFGSLIKKSSVLFVTKAEPKVPDAYSGYPMYCTLQGLQLEVVDTICINTSMPEHEAVPLSHKTCL